MHKILPTAAIIALLMPTACAQPAPDPTRGAPTSTPVLIAPDDTQARDMLLHVGRDSYMGRAYIVSASTQEVSTTLRARSYFSSAFRLRDDTQPILGDMEREWMKVYGHFHPGKSAVAFAQNLAAIDVAASTGVIAPEEKSRWRTHMEQLSPSDLDPTGAEFTDLTVDRRTFSSSYTDTSRRRSGDKHVVLIDLTDLAGTPSQTLVWYAERRHEQRRLKWKAFASIPGVTAVPYPHWETQLITENDASQEFAAQVRALVSTFPAGPEASLDVLSDLLSSNDEPPVQHIAPRAPVDGATMMLRWLPIQGIQPGSSSGQIRSLAKDQFHVTSGTDSSYGYIVAKKDEGIDAWQMDESQRVIQTKVDQKGRLWVLTTIEPRLTRQILTVCPVRINGNANGSIRSDRCMQSTMDQRWQLDRDGNSYLYSESHMATEERFPERIMDTGSGETIEMKELWKDRSNLRRRVFGYMQSCSSGPAPDLGDGLFWFTSCGLVGVAPASGDVANSFPLRSAGTERLVFGSAAGDWVAEEVRDPPEQRDVLRIHRLSTGEAAFEVERKTGTQALARTAHGRLLAMTVTGASPGRYVDVWRMDSGRHVSRLGVPEGIALKSLAFNRAGTELWVHAHRLAGEDAGVLIWPVPESLQDPADGNWSPDEAVLE
ncbi:hypothetical protein [Stenotrophomonas maltophilia]|uniref:hypothetical protein n=2 Tax=Stenotrophomonas maltophilia TaxID=40324 RepID=UPI00066E69F4|nr:hypothetical protein [Stenotrophomonas maltophilia]PZT02807.1 hypothetical protein A7X91_19400 [Stenotrophomonas maltophilia]